MVSGDEQNVVFEVEPESSPESLLGQLLNFAAEHGYTRLVVGDYQGMPTALGLRAIQGAGPMVSLCQLPQPLFDALVAVVVERAGLGSYGRALRRGWFEFACTPGGCVCDVVVVDTLRGSQLVLEPRVAGEVGWPLGKLGLEVDELARMRAIVAGKRGLFILTGQPGHGKTTLFGALVEEAAAGGRRVVAVESSVGTPRVDVLHMLRHPESDLPAEAWVDAALRLGGQVIACDDVPGREACARAVRGALAGSLVIYTLRGQDVEEAVRYLADLPLRAGFVASALQGVVATRLVTDLCQECCKQVALPLELIPTVRGTPYEHEAKWAEPLGCPSCSYTGMVRQRCLFELWTISHEQRQRLVRAASELELVNAAVRAQAHTIAEQALALAAQGVIGVGELVALF